MVLRIATKRSDSATVCSQWCAVAVWFRKRFAQHTEVAADCRCGVCAAVPAVLQADGDYYTRDEIVQDYPHLRQL